MNILNEILKYLHQSMAIYRLYIFPFGFKVIGRTVRPEPIENGHVLVRAIYW